MDNKPYNPSMKINLTDFRNYSLPEVKECAPKDIPRHKDYKAYRAFLVNKLSKQKGHTK